MTTTPAVPSDALTNVLISLPHEKYVVIADAIAALRAERDRLREALRALMGQIGNIEVLGEWEAQDINHTSRKKYRAKVNSVIEECRAALAAPKEGA